MSLTPATTDPNRKNELERRQRDQGSFGVTKGDNSRDRGTQTQREREQNNNKR